MHILQFSASLWIRYAAERTPSRIEWLGRGTAISGNRAPLADRGHGCSGEHRLSLTMMSRSSFAVVAAFAVGFLMACFLFEARQILPAAEPAARRQLTTTAGGGGTCPTPIEPFRCESELEDNAVKGHRHRYRHPRTATSPYRYCHCHSRRRRRRRRVSPGARKRSSRSVLPRRCHQARIPRRRAKAYSRSGPPPPLHRASVRLAADG